MEVLKIAFSQLGIQEIAGDENQPQIVKYAQETGISGIHNDEIPWCSTFVNWCAMKAELPYSGKPNARSWINIGVETTQPKPGDVVVFWRSSPHSWKGHVGFFLGFDETGDKVFCLGGNQSNSVSIAAYDASKVLSYRVLSESTALEVPTPILKHGSKGKEVIKLQLVLNHLKCNCGDVDGDFGNKTASALKLLQANNQLEIDGVYKDTDQTAIESLLQS